MVDPQLARSPVRLPPTERNWATLSDLNLDALFNRCAELSPTLVDLLAVCIMPVRRSCFVHYML